MSDREEMQANRAAGLVKRHETREARAIRKQVAEEIAAALVVERDKIKPGYPGWKYLNIAVATARRIGSNEEGS